MNNTRRESKIGIIYGEGIGFEIIEHTKEILAAISSKFDIHFDYCVGPNIKFPIKNKRGVVNPIYSFYDYAIKNNIPIISGGLSGGLVYCIRRRFDLFYKLIPIQSIPGYRTEVCIKAVDILQIRQNNAGAYFGKHGYSKSKSNTRIAFQNIKYSEEDIERIAAVAFRCASRRRQKITLLLKEDGFPTISGLWREIFQNNHLKFSGIEFEILNVDLGACELITNPSKFDVIVTLNHDGDIICDAMIAYIYGSRGMGCSGNFNNNGFASYQTVHGGGKDLVGKNKANPIGQILSAAMMLEHSFGLNTEANVIRKAIEIVLNNGYRTEDIFSNGFKLVSTQEISSLIAEVIQNL